MSDMPALVILAAGQGTRLRPLTDSQAKGMVDVAGRPLTAWQVDVARSLGIEEIVVVGGYRKEDFLELDVTLLENSRYNVTNMVRTLWEASGHFGEHVIVAYGDILYEARILEALLQADNPVSVVVDQGWQRYWEARFDDPLADAESLRMDEEQRIQSIGQPPESVEEIEAQYIGLMEFRGKGIAQLKDAYRQAEQEDETTRDGVLGSPRDLDGLYMTDLLQGMIDGGADVRGVPVNRGWIEIDDHEDLELARALIDQDADGLPMIREISREEHA